MERLLDLRVDDRRLAAVRHDTNGDATVVFCHGFRGERTGPNRTFVRAARALAEHGVSSVRFDQYGSGDSEGEFEDSRFDDWGTTIRTVLEGELAAGRRAAVLGQSMGASAALCAAAELPLSAVVAWVPDANIDPYRPDGSGFMEEGGQRVADAFWQQAHAADVPGALARVPAPCLLVLATDDEHVSAENREALIARARSDDVVDVLEGHRHSAWSADEADAVIARSVAFLLERLTPSSHPSRGTPAVTR